MILQALVEHYEDLAAQGRLDRPGGSAFCPHLPDLCYGYIFCHVLSD